MTFSLARRLHPLNAYRGDRDEIEELRSQVIIGILKNRSHFQTSDLSTGIVRLCLAIVQPRASRMRGIMTSLRFARLIVFFVSPYGRHSKYKHIS
jgi:hypothetical protein